MFLMFRADKVTFFPYQCFVVLFVTVFLTFSARFRDVLRKLFPHLPELPVAGGVSVHELNKPRRMTETSFVANKSVKTFGHHGFFFANISKLGNLPLAFLDFEDLELIPFSSIETPSDIGCHPSLLLTVLISFGWRNVSIAEHVAEEPLEKLYFPGLKWYFHLCFRAHADWIVYQSNLFEISRTRSFDILPNRFGILRLFVAKSFAVSWDFLWPFEKFLQTRISQSLQGVSLQIIPEPRRKSRRKILMEHAFETFLRTLFFSQMFFELC